MGREIRRVVANWEHPKQTKYNPFKHCEEESFLPLYDQCFENAIEEWIKEYELWKKGEHEGQKSGIYDGDSYWDYAGAPPRPEYYRPNWKPEEMTWWQVYETVSEGTPVTPAFATQEELVAYLVQNGDFWDQNRRKEGRSGMPCDPWSRAQAEKFVHSSGWAPSLVMENGKIQSGVEALYGEK